MRLLAEAFRSAVAQPVASAIAGLIVAGVCAVILSTTGQTVQAEQQVLSRIDAAGTRSVVITDVVGDAGITSDAIRRIDQLAGVEWVVGLGPATDVVAAGIAGGNRAPIRALHGVRPFQIHIAGRWPNEGEALVGPDAQRTLGLREPVGGVVGGTDLAVVGGFRAADPLTFLDRILIRSPRRDETDLRSIHILAADPSLVEPVTTGALLLLGANNPSSVAVETSETLADVRAAVAGEFGEFSRRLVALTLAGGLALTALAVYGAVVARRRDFGRRRALGATRPAIVVLVALQTGTAALVGAVLGSILTATILAQVTGVPPDVRFTVATIILSTLTAVVAAIPPSVVAAYSDPVRVLRVP